MIPEQNAFSNGQGNLNILDKIDALVIKKPGHDYNDKSKVVELPSIVRPKDN